MPDAVVQRAAADVARAARLRRAAAALRARGGALTYQPLTGEKPRAGADLTAALAVLAQVLNDLQRDAVQRAGVEAAITARGETAALTVRRAYAEVDDHARLVGAAVEVLRGLLADSDGATLDAPYGHGAPRRPHPGALCTVVAERAERLAQALESAAVLVANLSS
jgi:hypothetical protein